MATELEDGEKTPHVEDSSCPFSIQEVDPDLLRTSLGDRIVYLKDFIGFGRKDQEMLAKIGPLISDKIPQVVDALYAKLFEFDITKQVFMERNQGFDGPLPAKLEDLTLDSPQIIYRKIFMKNWVRRVLSGDFSSNKTWDWMDKVGLMHTGVKSFKHKTHVSPLIVPYRDCALTLGWVETVLQTAILQLPEEQLGLQEKIEAVNALSKLLWIQNDLFARHYINE